MFVNDRFGGQETTMALRSTADIVDLYRAGMTEARRCLRPQGRLFVKAMDQVAERGVNEWMTIRVYLMAEQLGMFARDQFLLIPNGGAQFRKYPRQIHARKGSSLMWIFEVT
jgi:hypothetical protein